MIPIALLAALGGLGGAGIGAMKGGGRGALLGGLLGGAGFGIPALMGMGGAGAAGAAGASATPALGPGLMEMSGALTPAGVGTADPPAAGGMSKMWPLIAMSAAPGIGGMPGVGRGRSAPPAGRAGMGRVGPLPAIYQNNPMQFKAMLAQFLRGG